MRLLADTHVLLWAVGAPERLSGTAREALIASDNEVSLSTASLWEIAIKLSLGRLELSPNWLSTLDEGRKSFAARWLCLAPTHCEAVASLPWRHPDPFDRMLVAQATCEGMMLVSKDRALADYSVEVLW